MKTSFFAFLALLLTSQNILVQPPMDLVSLVDPETSLELLGHKTDEASLIHLVQGVPEHEFTPERIRQAATNLGAEAFQERKQARKELEMAGELAVPTLRELTKSDDPEVSVTARGLLRDLRKKHEANEEAGHGYAAKLLAIRRLTGMKSKQALPVLNMLAVDSDPGLSRAAMQAVKQMEGEAQPADRGIASLKQVASSLPAAPSFIFMADTRRNSRVWAMLPFLKEQMKENKMVAALPALREPKQLQMQMIQILGRFGNVRIDSVTAVASEDLDENQGSFSLLFKGQYDMPRWDRTLHKTQGRIRLKRIEYRGSTLFFDRHGASICLVDENTFLVVMGPNFKDEGSVLPILDRMARKQAPPQFALDALERIDKGGKRISAAGQFSPPQKAMLAPEIQQEILGIRQRAIPKSGELKVKLPFMETLSAAIQAEHLHASMSDKGRLSLQGTFQDEKGAQSCAAALNRMEQGTRRILKEQGAEAPPEIQNLFAGVPLDVPLWEVKVEGGRVQVMSAEQADLFTLLSLMLLPMF